MAMQALKKIQQELKAPKGQYNSYGKYAYRSAEDILEAVKPLLAKYDAELILSDDITEVGGRIYVKATARFIEHDAETNTNDLATVTAFAREPAERKGMDESQITGTASSYARKYALNGLFLIDDNKDVDSIDTPQANTQPPQQAQGGARVNGQARTQNAAQRNTERRTAREKASGVTIDTLKRLITETNSDAGKFLAFFKVEKTEDLTTEQAKKAYNMLMSKKKKCTK
jgi:hypothetical protein